MLIFEAWQDIGLLALRFVVGFLFIYHGLPKVREPHKLAQFMGKPNLAWFAVVLGTVEALSGVLVIVGFLTEIVGILLTAILLSAHYFKIFKWKKPFSSVEEIGWEFDFALLGGVIVLMFLGAGAISIDSALGFWP